MTLDNLRSDIAFLTKTDTNSYPDADRVRNVNIWYHKVITMILEAIDGWDFDDSNHTDYPVLTTSLVANQRDYPIPVSEKVLKIKRIDICYDGTGNTCYKAEPIDSGEIGDGFGNDTDVDARFSKSKPYYDIRYNSIWIYPRADSGNVANSGILRIEWTREIVEFVVGDTSKEPGIDKPFHRMLSIGASLDYAIANDLPQKNNLAELLMDFEMRLRRYYGSKNSDRKLGLSSAYINYE